MGEPDLAQEMLFLGVYVVFSLVSVLLAIISYPSCATVS